MYSKTQGHHCWWLNKDGKSLANFDSESDVDDIIEQQKHIEFLKKQSNEAFESGVVLMSCELVNNHEDKFNEGGEQQIVSIAQAVIESRNKT